MSKINTMQVASTHSEPLYVSGERIRLQVGSVWIMFFAHDDGGTLSHWATGYKLGSLNGVKVQYMATMGHAARLNNRQASKMLIARLIDQHGVAKLLSGFDSHPVLNVETKKGEGIGTKPKP